MQYSFRKACINPIMPAYAVGFAVEKDKSTYTKLDLNLRLLRLKSEDKEIIMCAIDSLDVSYDVYLKFNEIVHSFYPDALFTITCSHTHYAPSLANQFPMLKIDELYLDQVTKVFREAVKNLPLRNIKASVSYNTKPFTEVGSTRVSANDANNVYAGALSFYHKDKRIGNIVFYNCHPTEDNKAPEYFSSAYVGATIEKLEEKYPDEFFMFMQGSCGDVSSRFTRKERSFNQTLEFGRLLSECFSELIENNTQRNELTLSHNSVTLDFDYTVKEVPEIPEALLETLKEAEKKELYIGIEELKKFRSMKNLPSSNTINLNSIHLGPYRLFTNPFELFSVYNELIDRNNTLLINYTNGALAYLLPVNNKTISYEYFLETVSNEDKLKLVEAIKNL